MGNNDVLPSVPEGEDMPKELECHHCEESIGHNLYPGVLVQMPLFEDEKEIVWCSSECFRKDKKK